MVLRQMSAFFIAGNHGAGKSYICKKITDVISTTLYLECGDTIRNIHQKSSCSKSKSLHEWIEHNEIIYGEHFAADAAFEVFKEIINKDCTSDILLISGCRSKNQIYRLSYHLGIQYPYIIFIEGVSALQKRNYECRERIQLTNDEYNKLVSYDNYLGLDELRKYVQSQPKNCLIVHNDRNDTLDMLSSIIAFIRTHQEKGILNDDQRAK